MKRIQIFNKSLYFWVRELHLYFGLFISPFIVVFAISTIMFNHTLKPKRSENVKIEHFSAIEIPENIKGGVDGWREAKQILRQLNVSGEIGPVHYRPQENHLRIPVFKPGQGIIVDVDLENRTAEVKRRRQSIGQTLLSLHRTPGPHRVKHPPNWILTNAWGWLADGVVGLILFVSASGVYMWAVIRAERKIGLLLLGAGALSFIVIMVAMVS